jgi:hypothetical protein
VADSGERQARRPGGRLVDRRLQPLAERDQRRQILGATDLGGGEIQHLLAQDQPDAHTTTLSMEHRQSHLCPLISADFIDHAP